KLLVVEELLPKHSEPLLIAKPNQHQGPAPLPQHDLELGIVVDLPLVEIEGRRLQNMQVWRSGGERRVDLSSRHQSDDSHPARTLCEAPAAAIAPAAA